MDQYSMSRVGQARLPLHGGASRVCLKYFGHRWTPYAQLRQGQRSSTALSSPASTVHAASSMHGTKCNNLSAATLQMQMLPGAFRHMDSRSHANFMLCIMSCCAMVADATQPAMSAGSQHAGRQDILHTLHCTYLMLISAQTTNTTAKITPLLLP